MMYFKELIPKRRLCDHSRSIH